MNDNINIEKVKMKKAIFPTNKKTYYYKDKKSIKGSTQFSNKPSVVISQCASCKRLGRSDCPKPTTAKGSWDRKGYYCPHFVPKKIEKYEG